MLDLSETSFNQLRPEKAPMERENMVARQTNSDAHVDITHLGLISAFYRVKGYITNISAEWSSERQCNHELLGALISHAVGRDINSAIYWLFIRLGMNTKHALNICSRYRLTRSCATDLAAALASDGDMCTPLLPSFPCLRERDSVADPFEIVFYCAYRPLWLCARAIKHVHNEEISPDRPALRIWMELVEELQQWYRERPPEFEPMLELEIERQLAAPERSFPVVLFANGAGLFGNQIYHTAMLILLHNRPRTARVSGFYSAAMSPLWHAQRICSIALHNDRRECWDPCLLASLLLAARRMTHESQQNEVMRGFDRIRTVTGWDAMEALQNLRAEWCLLDET
jgi:hypothetical protein